MDARIRAIPITVTTAAGATAVELISKSGFNLIHSDSCGKFAKTAQATGLENIGAERTLSGLLGNMPVNSLTRITLENNGRIRPQPDRENAFAGANGGAQGTAAEPSLDTGASYLVAFSKNSKGLAP